MGAGAHTAAVKAMNTHAASPGVTEHASGALWSLAGGSDARREAIVAAGAVGPLVKALITQQREVYDWEFIFLGADIDAIEIGTRMGMAREYSMNYNKHDYGTNRAAFASTREVISRQRMYGKSDDGGFSDEDRKRAMGR